MSEMNMPTRAYAISEGLDIGMRTKLNEILKIAANNHRL